NRGVSAVVGALTRLVQAGDTVVRDIDGEPLGLQPTLERGGQPHLVLDHQQPHRSPLPSTGTLPQPGCERAEYLSEGATTWSRTGHTRVAGDVGTGVRRRGDW